MNLQRYKVIIGLAVSLHIIVLYAVVEQLIRIRMALDWANTICHH